MGKQYTKHELEKMSIEAIQKINCFFGICKFVRIAS